MCSKLSKWMLRIWVRFCHVLHIVYVNLLHGSLSSIHFARRLCLLGFLLCVDFTVRCYASAVLAMALCPSVCPSQVGVLLKRLNESSWFLACELSTRPTLLKGNSVISKNKGTSLWNSVLKSGLRKFRDGISIVENLARDRWTLRAW